MKRSLRLAPSHKVPPLEPRAVRAVLDAWQGKDWLWCGEEELARLAVEACRVAFEEYDEMLGVRTEGIPQETGDGGSAA
jgi:hypothetical protein